MNGDLFAQLAQATEGLSRAESRVARLLREQSDEVVGMTVAQVAAAAGVSQATVVRLSRSLGYTGYPDLRIDLAQALSRRALEHERAGVAQGELSPADSVEDVVMKLAFHEARSIEETARRLDLAALDAAAEALAEAPRVTIVGTGASGLVAQDLGQKLQRIGRAANAPTDFHLQLQSIALLSPPDVAVAISFSGRTAEIRRAVELARANGVTAIAVTNDPDSPLARLADITLATSAQELRFRVGAFSSRMAQLAVIDALFVRVAQRHYEAATAALRLTHDAVHPVD
ncbi:MurR/RpiR family transcriptional regulator [Salana multivorans]